MKARPIVRDNAVAYTWTALMATMAAAVVHPLLVPVSLVLALAIALRP